MENIVYNFPKQHFLEVALPHLVEKCPHLSFHFIFVDSTNKEFEDLCSTADRIKHRITEFRFDRVLVYGSTTRAVKECVDVMVNDGFVDRCAQACKTDMEA